MNKIRRFSSAFYSIIVVLLLLSLSAEILVEPDEELPSLKVAPSSQDVYVLGNSMFGVGFDLSLARAELVGRSVDFAYYNGHYTSMWHLAIDVGMEVSTAPKILVWGFRPTYAAYPAFRQNRKTEEQKFRPYMNAAHRNILLNAGDPVYQGRHRSNSQDVKDLSQEAPSEVFQKLGEKIVRRAESHFEILSRDSEVLKGLIRGVAKWLADLSIMFGYSQEDFYVDGKLFELNNLLVEYTTDGRIKIADALVVDNGAQFIRGDLVSFDDSFLPEIVKDIREMGSQQLVVIFRPITTFDQPLDPELHDLYKDALSFLLANEVVVLDLMSHEGLKPEMYADGDHLNESGRKFVTGLIVEKLKSMSSD